MMKYTKHIEHKINVAPYETVTVGGSIEFDEDDHGDSAALMFDDIDTNLAMLLAPEIRQAKEIAQADSYVHEWVISSE